MTKHNLIQTLRSWLPTPAALCEICQARSLTHRAVCDGCLAQLPWNRAPCPGCGEPLLPGESRCGQCQRHPGPFREVIIPFIYDFPVSDWIHRFKYQEQPGIGQWLAQLLAEQIAQHSHAPLDAVLPVPMHPARQRQRGYNQSLLLARHIARQRALPCKGNILEKQRDTAHQRRLGGAARRSNLQGAYSLSGKNLSAIAEQHLAIVDDVVTTGATSGELARTLLEGGAASVSLWALAKTPQPLPQDPARLRR